MVKTRMRVKTDSGDLFDTGVSELTLEELNALGGKNTHGKPFSSEEEVIELIEMIRDNWNDFDSITVDDKELGNVKIRVEHVVWVSVQINDEVKED